MSVLDPHPQTALSQEALESLVHDRSADVKQSANAMVEPLPPFCRCWVFTVLATMPNGHTMEDWRDGLAHGALLPSAMDCSSYRDAAKAIVRARVLGWPTPLLVSWQVTSRCQRQCAYCGTRWMDRAELATGPALARIDTLRAMGTRWLTLSGGEPLLREDLGLLIRHARECGMHVFVSSNGALVPQRLDDLRAADRLTLSLDGPREVQERIRGAGAYRETLTALECCNSIGLPVTLLCVLSALNLTHADHAIEIAERHAAAVLFQPARRSLASSDRENPLMPATEDYRRTIDHLIDMKRAGHPIINSLAGLRHLRRWPEPTAFWCSAARLTCAMLPDGALMPCEPCRVSKAATPAEVSVQELCRVSRHIGGPLGCSECWCAPLVEIGLIASFHIEPAWSALRLAIRGNRGDVAGKKA